MARMSKPKNLVEQIELVLRLMNDGYSMGQISDKMKMGLSQVYDRQVIGRDPAVMEAIRGGKINKEQALAVLRAPDGWREVELALALAGASSLQLKAVAKAPVEIRDEIVNAVLGGASGKQLDAAIKDYQVRGKSRILEKIGRAWWLKVTPLDVVEAELKRAREDLQFLLAVEAAGDEVEGEEAEGEEVEGYREVLELEVAVLSEFLQKPYEIQLSVRERTILDFAKYVCGLRPAG